MKYCTVAKFMGRRRPIWMSVVVRRRLCARRLRSAAGSINSGRHILESRCAERCANDAFLTSFRATLTQMDDPQLLITEILTHRNLIKLQCPTLTGCSETWQSVQHPGSIVQIRQVGITHCCFQCFPLHRSYR